MAPLRFLMCPPEFFEVAYVINPWMEGQVHAADRSLAIEQWLALHGLLSDSAEIISMPAVDGLPDLVFTANAGLVYGGKAIVSSFRFPERQGESPRFAAWFESHGFEAHQLPPPALFEGAGDALFDRSRQLLWLGYGMRSNYEAIEPVERLLDVEVQALRLQNPSFYHLDTCFCPLNDGYLLYFPEAFDEASRNAIERRVPTGKRLPVDSADAARFACNAVNIRNLVIANSFSQDLESRLSAAGFQTVKSPLSEFMRAGGAAKCLSLRLDEGA